MNRLSIIPFAAALLLAAPVQAALTQAQLADAELAPPAGAHLPPDLALRDETGRPITSKVALGARPAVLVLADYTCVTLCGTALGVAAAALAETGLRPDTEYSFLALGMDPRDGPAEAAAMKQAFLGNAPVGLQEATRFLSGPASSLDAALAALGYRAVFDAENDRYAHPTGVVVLTGDGAVSRVLDGFALDASTLRLAIVEASEGRVGTLGDRLRLLCYGLDPAHGIYNGVVKRALTAGTIATTLALGAFVFDLSRRRGTSA